MTTCQLPEFLSHCTRTINIYCLKIWFGRYSLNFQQGWHYNEQPVSILFDIEVPLEDKVIFQSGDSFSIWEMLTKFSGFFWKIYCIKEKFVSVRRRWFSFGLLNFVESFSITQKLFLKYFFSYCSYGKLVHQRDIYHGGENFCKTCIF